MESTYYHFQVLTHRFFKVWLIGRAWVRTAEMPRESEIATEREKQWTANGEVELRERERGREEVGIASYKNLD